MAFPAIVGTPTESNATADDASPFTVSRPAGVNGQLTIVIIGVDGNPTLTWPAAYTQFFTQSRAGTLTIYGAYHQEDGTETTTFDITSSASEKWAAIVYSISGAANPTTQVPQAATVDGSVASNTPDPPSLTPTGGAKDYLWIAAVTQDGEEADDDTWANTPPASYTPSPPRQKSTDVGAAATTNVSTCTAERQLNAASDNPGTFGVDQSLTYVAATIAIHPVSPTIVFFKTQTDSSRFAPVRDVRSASGFLFVPSPPTAERFAFLSPHVVRSRDPIKPSVPSQFMFVGSPEFAAPAFPVLTWIQHRTFPVTPKDERRSFFYPWISFPISAFLPFRTTSQIVAPAFEVPRLGYFYSPTFEDRFAFVLFVTIPNITPAPVVSVASQYFDVWPILESFAFIPFVINAMPDFRNRGISAIPRFQYVPWASVFFAPHESVESHRVLYGITDGHPKSVSRIVRTSTHG